MLMTDKLNKNLYTGGWTEAHHELTSESRLWKHVMCQAISDSYLGTHHEKTEVARWIKSEDFDYVCDHSNLNSEHLFKMIKEILTSKPVISRYLGERLKRVIQNRDICI